MNAGDALSESGRFRTFKQLFEKPREVSFGSPAVFAGLKACPEHSEGSAFVFRAGKGKQILRFAQNDSLGRGLSSRNSSLQQL
jgi:hypothetical protein